MKTAQKYSFKFLKTTWDSPVVQAFFYAHLQRYGYPTNILPAATSWCAVVRGEGVYCVYGWHPIAGGAMNLSDFYTWPSRWGTLAAYAALERIRYDLERTGKTIYTPTPARNTPMIRAYKRVFDVPEDALPELLVYRWEPKVQPKLAEVS